VIQLGACVWNFNAGPYRAPYEDAIRAAAKVGFTGAELIIFDENDIRTYFTSQKVKELKQLISDVGMSVVQVDIYDHPVHDLASLNAADKIKAVDNARRCVDIAAGLGATVLNTVSQWPIELSAPIPYPPSYIYPDMRGVEKLSSKWTLNLPRRWNWEETWDNYVDSIRRCVDIAAAAGLTFSIEGHCHVIVSGTDSMLRLVDALDGHPNLGFTLDTGWHLRQREYLPMSIHKLGKRLKNLHVRDTDGLLNYSLPPGQGIVDWGHVVEALLDVGYDGFLSVEMANLKDPSREFGWAKSYLESILEEANRAGRNAGLVGEAVRK
jgi:sugar phosphate isomerase/epimerase